jgi:multidrug resistance efflux pump
MKSQTVIPTPPSVRWREFRMTVLPGLTMIAAAVLASAVFRNSLFPANIIGRVETTQANVVSVKPGALTHLNVSRFQSIRAGEPVATIITTDPKVLSASLAVIQAEVEVLRAGLAPLENVQRNAINYEQLRLEMMRQQVLLATAKVDLQQFESEFARMEKLYQDKLISASDYDMSRRLRDAKATQVEEQGKLVAQSESSLDRLGQVAGAVSDPQRQVSTAIAVEEKKLKLIEAELSPLILTAPIDGLVAMIHRRNGENIAAGDPIITISASHTDHIVGYLRQPLQIQPDTNMVVRIRTRGASRQVGEGRVLSVGAHLQPINDALLPPTRYDSVELGLPILVSLPRDLMVHPGEFVDLTLLPKK